MIAMRYPLVNIRCSIGCAVCGCFFEKRVVKKHGDEIQKRTHLRPFYFAADYGITIRICRDKMFPHLQIL